MIRLLFIGTFFILLLASISFIFSFPIVLVVIPLLILAAMMAGAGALYYAYCYFSQQAEEGNLRGKIRSNSKIGHLFKEYQKEKDILDRAVDNLSLHKTCQEIPKKILALQDRCFENCKKYIFIEKNYGEDRARNELDSLIVKISKASRMMSDINDKMMKLSLSDSLDNTNTYDNSSNEFEEVSDFLEAQIQIMSDSTDTFDSSLESLPAMEAAPAKKRGVATHGDLKSGSN